VKIHHLNCGTMRMPGASLVCHVLLVETERALVLVDTGFGLRDIADPRGRLGGYRHVSRPALDPAETAVRQVRALGYAAEDVRHVLLTHLDSDHAGGLADFPHARVHVTRAEWEAARRPASGVERSRYRAVQWAHDPQIVTHDQGGESWRGFAAAAPLDEVAPGLVLIPLPGHTRGHAAYAVDDGGSWLLHAGDAFYHRSVLDGRGRQPFALTLQEAVVAADRERVRDNHARLAELHGRDDPDLMIVSSHDPSLLDDARRRGSAGS
jgi:glyoxylase-like metal-dependent hydrolase (beta-lactamase superfamily II)